MLILYEDLRWIDPTSGEFLDEIVENCRDVPLFLMGTSRPSAGFALPERPHVTVVPVNQLEAAESR